MLKKRSEENLSFFFLDENVINYLLSLELKMLTSVIVIDRHNHEHSHAQDKHHVMSISVFSDFKLIDDHHP